MLGEAAPNDQYTGLRLVYGEGPAQSLDPLSWRFFLALCFHWLIGYALSWVLIGLLFLLGVRSPDAIGIVWLLWFVAFAFTPVLASISEWKFMVDGKGEAAPQAFDHIAWVIRARETPINRLSVRRVRLGLGASRDYLYGQMGMFRGYVSCFSFGRDLYIGWTFWWRLSTIRWWLLFIQRLFHIVTLRGSEVHSIHRYDNAKALREAIHSAARQGVDAASGEIAFQGSGTIGTDIPIDTLGPREGLERLSTGTPG